MLLYTLFLPLQNFIFVFVGVLAWLVPDIPQSVLNEIRREKVLAYNTIFRRDEEIDGESKPPAETKPPAAEPSEDTTMI